MIVNKHVAGRGGDGAPTRIAVAAALRVVLWPFRPAANSIENR